jgi:uncharacterized membrane protein YvbJ
LASLSRFKRVMDKLKKKKKKKKKKRRRRITKKEKRKKKRKEKEEVKKKKVFAITCLSFFIIIIFCNFILEFHICTPNQKVDIAKKNKNKVDITAYP